MKILSLSIGHDASCCILENGKIKRYSSSERHTRIKHDYVLDKILINFLNEGENYFDTIIISYIDEIENRKYLVHLLENLNKNFSFMNLRIEGLNHHLLHAYGAFYNSGFENAICVVLDAGGSYNYTLSKNPIMVQETESVYYFSRGKKEKILHKKYKYAQKSDEVKYDFGEYIIHLSNDLSVGMMFDKCGESMGLTWCSAGKIMGLSQYYNNVDLLDSPWKERFNSAYQTQNNSLKRSLEVINHALSLENTNNLVVSGGYALNCVSNYEYLRQLKETNIYIDPICFDAGICIGGAYKAYIDDYGNQENIDKLSHVYLGDGENEYNLTGLKYKKTSKEEIVDLLLQQNIVALFQGKSEAGQRSLGNRSLLFDPRNVDGKNIVNKIKERESFRPFAGTVLYEHCKEWFDMRSLEESPFMLYAVKVIKEEIPAITHVDKTCRIQTLKREQNQKYYDLIEEFYKKTNVPILLNTSFNLAGDPLVQTFKDAIDTLHRSQIKYLYLPEVDILVESYE